MKFKPIKNLIKILCAAIISFSIALPAWSIKPATSDSAVIQQIKVNNNLSQSIINRIYGLLNSSNTTKNLTKSELFLAKSSLSELKSQLENLFISDMTTAQEILNKLNILRGHIANKASLQNITELTKNMNETAKYIKNIPRKENPLISLKKNAQKLLANIKDPKIHNNALSKLQELTACLEKIPALNLSPKTPVVEKLNNLNLFFRNILDTNSKTTNYYALNKLFPKIDELIDIIKKSQTENSEKIKTVDKKILPIQTDKKPKNELKKHNLIAQNVQHTVPANLARSERFKSRQNASPPKKPNKTILDAQAQEASKIEVLADDGLQEQWKSKIQAGVQGRSDCWLFSAINVQNWFNFKNNQKIIRGQADVHKEFLSKGESKQLLGRSQNQFIITRYLQKCGFDTYVVLSGLKQNDKESLKFNKSLAEILIKKHFAKSQVPIILHKEHHWDVIAGINTQTNKVLVVDSAFGSPFWTTLQDLYDSISGVTCIFKSKVCYALGMIFVVDAKKSASSKTISILQSNVNSSDISDIFNTNQFLIAAIDAASK